jgi:hypothetical protein
MNCQFSTTCQLIFERSNSTSRIASRQRDCYHHRKMPLKRKRCCSWPGGEGRRKPPAIHSRAPMTTGIRAFPEIPPAAGPGAVRILIGVWEPLTIPRSLSDLGNRSENSAGRGQILSILQGNSCSIAQKSGEIWTVQTDLQQIYPKSDRLLVTEKR